MIEELASLLRHLERVVPGASTVITEFPSGGWVLDVRAGERLLVMAYSPIIGFGVDEITGDEGFDSGYAHSSRDFESAAAHLVRLASGRQAA